MSLNFEPLGGAVPGYPCPNSKPWSAAPAKPKPKAGNRAKTNEPIDKVGRSARTQHPSWLHDPKACPEAQSLKRRPLPPPKGEMKVKEMKRSDMKRSAADIKTEDMIKLFGPDGARLKAMAKDRPDITIGNLMRLKRVGIDQVYDATKLLATRPDLNLNDIIDNVGNGNALMKPATYHNEARALMDYREGTRPDDLSQMGDQFRHTYGEKAGEAFGKASDLLHYRKDLTSQGLQTEANRLPAGAWDAQEAYERFAQNYADGRTTNKPFNVV